MIRLRRAGREYAIKEAIRKLEKEGKYKMFTKGEICRKMGIKSTSRIRDLLMAMASSGELVGADTALDGYKHEIAVYGLPVYEQMPLPESHVIVINGKAYLSDGKEADQNAVPV